MFLPRTPTSNRASSGSSYIFSLCRRPCRSTESLSIMFLFFFLPPFCSSFPASFLHSLLSGFMFFFWMPLPTPFRSHQLAAHLLSLFLIPTQPPHCWPLQQHRPVPRLAALPDNFKNRIDVERILGMKMGMILVSILHQFGGSWSHVYAVFFDQQSLSAYVWIMYHYNRKMFDHFSLELLRYI